MTYFKTQLSTALLALLLGGSAYAEQTQPSSEAPASTQANKGTSLKEGANASPDIIYVQYYGVILERLQKDTVDFSFPKGSADLSAQQKLSLDTMVPTINADKNIERVVVTAWSDRPYPAAKGEKLSDAERKLAEKRADNIRKYLKDKGVGEVDVYSMAEKPSWFAKVFQTENAQIKGANKKLDNDYEEKIHSVIESRGGPSKAIVFFQRDWKNKGMGS